jgi:hypothetical protein
MQFALDLMQKIPAGWPRWATLAAIVIVYFFFPSITNQLIGGRQEKETLDRITRFLQMKKLLLELEALQKEKNLVGYTFPGEARLLAELQESATAVEQSPETIPYVSRLQYSLLGGAVFFYSRRSCLSSAPFQRRRHGGPQRFSCGIWVWRPAADSWLLSSLWGRYVRVLSTV